ncbi:MAG TPA: N,N-dimethylformamidase beta subunit family domain-containing protein, partial [Dongiaceae bacterium]
MGVFETMTEVDRYLEEHPGLGMSVYDNHSDGSGVCYSSSLRPILNMRPKTHLWQFNADTHITDWLEAEGIEYDIITDDDLEREGLDLLKPYRCVMTGTHPEYYTLKMLDAVQAFTDLGGRLVYLGANGFYWRIAYHPELPGVIEHRRAEDGMRAWFSEGGEYYMGFTGELSGLWRRMDRAPNMLVGAGFTAQGFDHSAAYHRRPESFDPRAAFIFEGIGKDEVIGDFGVLGGGAAGWEIDRADHGLGTPRHALIVAEATEFPASYHWVKEEFNHSHSAIDGETCPFVRCDMMFFETPNGGAVFSTSSISWAGSLAHKRYKNNVSRITANVVRRFLDPAPFPL